MYSTTHFFTYLLTKGFLTLALCLISVYAAFRLFTLFRARRVRYAPLLLYCGLAVSIGTTLMVLENRIEKGEAGTKQITIACEEEIPENIELEPRPDAKAIMAEVIEEAEEEEADEIFMAHQLEKQAQPPGGCRSS